MTLLTTVEDGTYHGLDVDGGTPSAAESRIRRRRGTAKQWSDANPVLAEGEETVETDTGALKRGDGVTAYLSLPDAGGMAASRAAAGLALVLGGV